MATNKAYKKYTTLLGFLLIYAALIITLIIWLFGAKGSVQRLDILQSPAIIVIAIVISVLTFTISSAVFAAIGKGKNNSALGMPDGSIRALIALSLIALFFILATQIYSKVSNSSVGKLERVSEDELKSLTVKDIVSRVKIDSLQNALYNSDNKIKVAKYLYFYNVEVKVPVNQEAGDMAKNIIASFTALIAAISGFYFGSASSKQNSDQKTDNTLNPKITPKNPVPPTGKQGVSMTFEWDVIPQNQPIVMQVIGDTAQPVPDVKIPNKFTYVPSNAATTITLKVYMKNNPAVSQEYPITITS